MPERVAVDLAPPGGEQLRVEWEIPALEALGDGAIQGARPWRLGGELDWERVGALRVITARFEDERAIAIAALRPAGAEGHDAEVRAGAVLTGGVAEALAEALVSTEYGPDGEPRRLGLELYTEREGMPLRVAADVTATAHEAGPGVRRTRAALALRLAGVAGSGELEVLAPG